jgi:hypothetical protein
MRVARQIGQHRLGPGERPLGVDHPFAFAQRRHPGGEGCGVGQRAVLTEEPQLLAVVQALQFLQEATPDQPRQHAHRQEEAGPAGNPTLAIRRQPAAGHDAVHVRVMRQRRTPRVQHQRGADVRSKVLGIGGNLQQRLGSDVEEQAVQRRLALVRDLGHRRRQREDDVVVLHRQQIGLSRIEPPLGGTALLCRVCAGLSRRSRGHPIKQRDRLLPLRFLLDLCTRRPLQSHTMHHGDAPDPSSDRRSPLPDWNPGGGCRR